jgi:hypothetical protein
VKFQIFSDGNIVNGFAPSARIFRHGRDQYSPRDRVRGRVHRVRPAERGNRLRVVWPIGVSANPLPTTRVPERERPHILTSRLLRQADANHEPCEDWSFFDGLEGMEDVSKQSQDLFIKAIQNINNAPLASKLADAALRKAMVYSEKLAGRQGKSLFDKRRKNRKEERTSRRERAEFRGNGLV